MNKQKNMSLWGIGPLFTLISGIIIAASIFVDIRVYPDLSFRYVPIAVVLLFSIPLISIGLFLWIIAGTQIDKCILSGVLADRGVYGLVRNPIYSGELFTMTGMLLLSRSLILFAVPLLLYLLLKLLLIKEEKVITRYFGNEYLNYKKRVNAVIPKPIPLINLLLHPRKMIEISTGSPKK